MSSSNNGASAAMGSPARVTAQDATSVAAAAAIPSSRRSLPAVTPMNLVHTGGNLVVSDLLNNLPGSGVANGGGSENGSKGSSNGNGSTGSSNGNGIDKVGAAGDAEDSHEEGRAVQSYLWSLQRYVP